VFHLRTKAYFFEQGLFVGKGGYKGTGRGFGLDRVSLVDIYKCYFDSHFHNAIVLLAVMIVYWFVGTESESSFLLRDGSVLLLVFSWITAPIIFNPYATADALHTDLEAMSDWTLAALSMSSLNEHKLHIANSETKDGKRKDLLKGWVNEKVSWQAWFIQLTIDQWEEEDSWGRHPLNIFKMFLQKTVLYAWRYFPWVLLGQFYFRLPSLNYFISFAFISVFSTAIDERYTNQHEHFTIWKASVLIVIPSMVVFFLYGNMTMGEVIMSICLCLMVCFVAMDIVIGFLNMYIKISGHLKDDEPRDLLIERLKIPRVFFRLQRFWPFVCIIILAGVNLFTVVFCGGLTTLLFNGRVADMWNRAYLFNRQL